MKRKKVCALFCFLVVLVAGCFAVACDEEHTHDYQAEVTAPTCTEQGYTTYTCPEDGESYVGNYVPALGHAPADAVRENETAATCVSEGSYDSVVYCSRCGEELSREKVTVDATGHSPAAAVRENEIAATCVLAGSYDSVVYCAECGEELSREEVTVEASGHAWDEGTVKAEATCAQAGEVVYTCTLCGETRTESVPKKDHTPGGGPTCTEPQICVFCETVLAPAKGHTVETVAATEATCTERGNTAGTRCSVCGEVLSGLEPIPANGHTMVDNVCTVCNAISMSAITVGSGSTVAVHDPSVVVAYADAFGNTYAEAGDGRQKVYFVFGTQFSNAYSYDMESWVTFTPTFYGEGTTTVSTDHAQIFKTAAAWSDYTDAATIKGNLWAPDIIYNPAMEKWCLYYSMSGDSSNFRSSVFLMTADNITGPYEFDDFVVFSGFAPADKGSGAGLDDYKAVTGDADGSELGRYVNSENKWNNNYGVSCIDPAVLYDEAGDLWMFYGSWSGGIFLLKLDNETGLRDTSRTYGSGGQPIYDTDEKTALREDPYLGIHVAGGWYVSGEGPYVEYIDGYYYLFLSYGFYSPDGGYNMRVFRAKDITGDYVDPDGTWAVYDRYLLNYGSDVSHGLSFMQNYKWSWWTGPASIAQGHNSVLTDDGNVYLVYHIKYDDGSVQHNVEVHRLVEGKEGGWYLVAPFQKSRHDRILTEATQESVAGNWSVIVHRPIANYGGMEYNTDEVVILNADGTLSGAYTGTWSAEGQYITIATTTDGTFEGVLMEQQIEGMESEVVTYTFTAMNEDGLCIWGARFTDEMAAQLMADRITFPDAILGDLDFEKNGLWGTTISYSSSNTDVLANDGTFTAPETDTELTLTVTVSIGSASISQTKTFTIKGLSEASILGMLPADIADDGYLVKVEPGAGGSIAPIGGLSSYTGVSITFRVKDVKTDWDVMFRTPGGTQIYLSVLNYKNVNIFESAATLSEEGEQFLTENGYGVTGFNHVIFLDEVEANQKNGSVATISYNVDGSITFYRNGELMLTYAADTPIKPDTGGPSAGPVKSLVANIIAQIRTRGLNVVYPVSNVIVGYAADYDESKVPEERPVKETIGTDNGDGTYTLAFDTWYLEQEVKGDFKVKNDINVKAPKLLATGNNWYNWLVKIGDWKLRSDRYSMNGASGNADLGSAVQYTGTPADWAVFRQNYFDADVILTIQRTGVKVVVTADVTSLSTGDEFTYTATYANFGPDNTTVSLGGEDCLISVYEVKAESGQEPVEPSHEHSFGAYVDDVATCECGATKVKYVVGSTTAEVVFESRENAEVVDRSADNDPSGWWGTPVGLINVSGDFAVRYYWKNAADQNFYHNAVLEMTDGTNYFDMNILNGSSAWGSFMTNFGTVTHEGMVTKNGAEATPPSTETSAGFSCLGDYSASLVRIGSTLIVRQKIKLENGDIWEAVDKFSGFTTSDLTVQINGNPYFADDLRVTVGEMNKTGMAAMDKELGNPDNSTGYTGTTPLWTSTIQQGQKITVTGTATSSGANVYNSPLAYLWTGNTASLNFRADNWVNGVDEGLGQSGTEANVADFNFYITKTWQGFEPTTVNGSNWTASLVNYYKQGAFDCTVTWDYSEANKIVVQYSFAWEDATFNQQYTITPQSGDLLDTYSIGLGVDCAYYHVTGMTVE